MRHTKKLIITVLSCVLSNNILANTINVSPSIVNFKAITVDSGSSSNHIEITNTDSAAHTLGALTLSGVHSNQFSIENDPCSNQTLEADQSCTVNINFTPTERGNKQAVLEIPNDSTETPILQVFLTTKEDTYSEAARRLPPVLNSVNIPETLQAGKTYRLEWSILGYHNDYYSDLALFNCTGIGEGSCGNSYNDATKFFDTGNIAADSVTDTQWYYNDIQAREFKYHTDFTPEFDQDTPIVARFYRLNSDDSAVGNAALSLIIPGNLSEKYYDKEGRRIEKMIVANAASNKPSAPTLTTTPNAANSDSTQIEVNGEVGSTVWVNGVQVATIGDSGKVTIDLDTSGNSANKSFQITLRDTNGNESEPLTLDLSGADTTPPNTDATVDSLQTASTSPALTGNLPTGDSDAETALYSISVEINGKAYTASNNGDRTWRLDAGTITSLDEGFYDVILTITDANNNSTTTTLPNKIEINNTGFLIDSAVEGVKYVSGKFSGYTDSSGLFKYDADSDVKFYIGDEITGIALGGASVKTDPHNTKRKIINLFDLAKTDDENDPKVVNMARFLMSFDVDKDPSNGITIDKRTRESIALLGLKDKVHFDATVDSFEADENLYDLFNDLADHFGEHRGLIPAEDAKAHVVGVRDNTLPTTNYDPDKVRGDKDEIKILTGVFKTTTGIVEGLEYRSGNQFGRTNARGEFQYEEGKSIKFNIYQLELGTTDGNDVITPANLVAATSFNHPKPRNIVRLLAYFDAIAGDNKITIDEAVREALEKYRSQIDLNLSDGQANEELGIPQGENEFSAQFEDFEMGWEILNEIQALRESGVGINPNAPPAPSLTSTPATTTSDTTSVEVNGEVGASIWVDGVQVGTIDSTGKAIIDLDTSGASGNKTFQITLKDASGFKSQALVVTIEKEDVLPSKITRADAMRFLGQATFTRSESDIRFVEENGYEKWLEAQLAMPYKPNMHLKRMIRLAKKVSPSIFTATEDEYLADNNIIFNKNASFNSVRFQMSAWFETAMLDEDQLRHKMAYALSQIIVESLAEPIFTRRGEALAVYFDILTKNALGNYRDLLLDISHSSSMGLYLTYSGSRKEYIQGTTAIYPDENYAREVMQLFTIGLKELNLDGTAKLDASGNPIPTYNQTDVNQLARVFTGWDTNSNEKFARSTFSAGDFTHPLELKEEYHDTGEKFILGKHIPAGNTGDQDIEAAIDILMDHPNIAPFVSKQLIMRLTKSNPSPAYVKRVATVFNDNGNQVKGDLKAVVKAILLDPEVINDSSIKKYKEPLLAFTQFLSAFHFKPFPKWSIKGSENELTDALLINDPSSYLGQAPSRAFTVFNFYNNNYIPSNEQFIKKNLVAPEIQIQTDSQLINFNNTLSANMVELEKRYLTKIRGSLNVAPKNIGANRFLLDASEEYDVLEKALEGSVDGVFNPFHSVTRVDDPVDKNGLTARDRALKALITHLDKKLTGGRLPTAEKDILFDYYKEVFYYEKMGRDEDPEARIYRSIILPIIMAIVSSETFMVE